MSFTRTNALRPKLDIAGTATPSSSLNLQDEVSGLGASIQSGSSASITVKSGSLITIAGLSAMSASSVGRYLTISGANSNSNNGTFIISAFNSSSSVNITNSAGVAGDINNGAISWIERHSYSLEDDLNFIRTDRTAIKGVGYSENVPTYTKPISSDTAFPVNLSNIAGKTLDAKAVIIEREVRGLVISATDSFIKITNTGNLKHADGINRTGVPVFDGADIDNHDATYVKITDASTTSGLQVLAGNDTGKTIYGRTRAGSSIAPNEVEIEFRAATGYDLANSVPYVWENGQSTSVNIIYGYREQLDQLDESAFRSHIATPIGNSGTSGITATEHSALRQLIHLADGVGGPMEGFLSGAYREILPVVNPFPTQIIWWESSLKLKKIVEKNITRNANQTPATTSWTVYDTDGVTALHTITDTHSYSGIFETNRTRAIV